MVVSDVLDQTGIQVIWRIPTTFFHLGDKNAAAAIWLAMDIQGVRIDHAVFQAVFHPWMGRVFHQAVFEPREKAIHVFRNR